MNMPVPVAARLLRSWVRILPGTWVFVCCECCVLTGRGLCDELIARPEESYRLWYVVNTVIPRLTSDPANEFSANEDFCTVLGLG
jgi:hypothetical protein